MVNPWIILIALISIIASFIGGDLYGHHQESVSNKASNDKARIEAIQSAVQTERYQQEKVNAAIKKQNDDLSTINSRLNSQLVQLRKRPARPAGLSEAPRVSCEGANGPELAAKYAEFLGWYSALAAKQDAALAACYAHADAINNKVK